MSTTSCPSRKVAANAIWTIFGRSACPATERSQPTCDGGCRAGPPYCDQPAPAWMVCSGHRQPALGVMRPMKRVLLYAFPCVLLLTPALAGAQTGCIHSPECPTALLGVVGAAGA